MTLQCFACFLLIAVSSQEWSSCSGHRSRDFINAVGFRNSQTTRNTLQFMFCFIFHFSIL